MMCIHLHICMNTYMYECINIIYALDVVDMNAVQFCGLEPMDRGVTSGVTAAGALAVAQHFLTSAEPRVDFSSICPRERIDPWSFLLGVAAGVFLFGAIEAFVTLRWCITSLVQRHLVSAPIREPAVKKQFRFLDEQ